MIRSFLLPAILACLIILCVFSTSCGISASVVYGSITGTVRDANTGSPINTAVVTARTGGTIVTSTTTDSNGVYRVEDLQPGTYSLTATRTGYEDGAISVTVTRATEASSKDFALEPSA